MTKPDTDVRRWLNRPARPTAGVVLAAAVLLAALVATTLIDLFTAPLPPVQYGPFDSPQALTCAMAIMALFFAFGIRAARGLSPKALIFALLLLSAAGPVGWGLAFLDSQGPDVINSGDSTGAFVAMILLVVAPLLTFVGVVAGLAEIIRHSIDTPERTTLPGDRSRDHTDAWHPNWDARPNARLHRSSATTLTRSPDDRHSGPIAGG